MNLCRQCGKALTQARPNGRQKKYCNQVCCDTYRQAAGRARTAEQAWGDCKVCGKPITGHKRKYCSKKCCGKTRPARSYVKDVKCHHCGDIFRSATKRLYYSLSCALDHNKTAKECDWCCTEYTATYERQRFCTTACRSSADSRKKRARINSAYVEDVGIGYLYKRDGGRCQLCGKTVKMGLHRFDPRSATIDHIVPLSQGGKHSKPNTQLAHRFCNMSKGARRVGQLRLMA